MSGPVSLPKGMSVRIEAPAGFSFRRTVLSHGWCMLAPFQVDHSGDSLGTMVALPGGGASRIRLTSSGSAVLLQIFGKPSTAATRHLTATARRILSLDQDLSSFHASVRRVPELAWIARTGSGRLLRCPTVFEDLVKLVLTTNCTWSLTTRMVQALVDSCGEAAPDGGRAFPTPAALARVGEHALRHGVKVGYRAPYLAKLARQVAEGEVDTEAWATNDQDSEALRKELLALPGVGPYVAENLLKFLGRPRGLALDSWMRAKYSQLHHKGRRVSDRTIARRYGKLGAWAGLAVWFELTKDWFEEDSASAALVEYLNG